MTVAPTNTCWFFPHGNAGFVSCVKHTSYEWSEVFLLLLSLPVIGSLCLYCSNDCTASVCVHACVCHVAAGCQRWLPLFDG